MRVVVLTGAGISAESGLKTFRDKDGLWEGNRPEELATPEAFRADPDTVHAFYNFRRRQLKEVEPNPAHEALVTLESALGEGFFLVTQNVDDLHERAGSRRVLSMHGKLREVRCLACGEVHPWEDDLGRGSICPSCGRDCALRPNIVWFGEIPQGLDQIGNALEGCDLFAAIGTSGVVEPAASLAAAARRAGARTVEINLQNTARSTDFDEHRVGPASEKVPGFVRDVIAAVDHPPGR